MLSGKSSGPQLVVTRTAPPTPPESAPGRPANSNNNISSALDGIAELQQVGLATLPLVDPQLVRHSAAFCY